MGNPITDLISHFYNYGSFNEGQPNQVKTEQLPPEVQDKIKTLGEYRDKYGVGNAPNTQKYINMFYNPKTRKYAIDAYNDGQSSTGPEVYGGRLIEELYRRASNPIKYGYTPADLPKQINFFRGGSNPKNTTSDGLETRPSAFNGSEHGEDLDMLYRASRALGQAKKLGLTSLSPTEIAAFALKEGRGDIGVNGFDGSNPKSRQLYNKLTQSMDGYAADVVTTLQEKADLAKRKGLTLQEAWNGTGVNSFGISGRQYSQDWSNHLKAASHPKNKPLLDFINRAYRGE